MTYERHLKMERLCTVAEIAAAAGVAVGTVHRVLKGTCYVRPEKVAQVLTVMNYLNSRVIARAIGQQVPPRIERTARAQRSSQRAF